MLQKYDKEGSIAVGDSENDIEMLEQVEMPLCFQPDEKLLKIAEERKWLVADEATIVSKFEKVLY